MRYIVFDMEWNQPVTGVCKVVNGMRLTGEIIQIGAVMLDKDLNDIADFKAMVAPQHYTVMNRNVENLTHITQSDIDNGRDFTEVILNFFNWCGEDCALCTWGPEDAVVLAENMRIHGLDYTNLPIFIDLQKVFSKQVLGTETQCALLRALEILGEPAYEAHDALNDADNTVSVLWHLDMNADLRDCISGTGGDERTDYLRKDRFTLTAKSYSDALKDMTLKFFISPVSGSKVLCSKWITERPGQVISIARGIDGMDYFLSLSMKRKNGRYNANRTVWLMDDEMRQHYDSIAAYQSKAC